MHNDAALSHGLTTALGEEAPYGEDNKWAHVSVRPFSKEEMDEGPTPLQTAALMAARPRMSLVLLEAQGVDDVLVAAPQPRAVHGAARVHARALPRTCGRRATTTGTPTARTVKRVTKEVDRHQRPTRGRAA